MKDEKKSSESIVINEVQLLLAEKRTSLSVMRTGIAVLVVPLSVLSLLIATSKYYDIFHVISMFITLSPCVYFRSRLYLRMHHIAHSPSFQVIFFPSPYVRPEYEMPTS